MDLELDLKEIVKLFRERLDVLIIIPLVCLVTSLIFSILILTPSYSSSTTLIINKTENVSPVLDYNTIMANKQIVRTYQQIATSRTVMEDVNNKLQLNFTLDEINNMVKVNAVGDTELIQITVTDINPKRARIIAAAFAESFIDKIEKTINVENIKIIDPPLENPIPVKPKIIVNVIVAFLFGLILSILIILIINYLDNTIKTKEDVEKVLHLPVLGSIPVIE